MLMTGFAAVACLGYQVAPPLLVGPVLRRAARTPAPLLFEDDKSARKAAQAAGTVALHGLLQQASSLDECSVPHEEGSDSANKGVVIFLRHGESSWNAENRFTGWHDVPLSEAGQQQAKDAASVLCAAGYAGCLDRLYTSALKRTIKTGWLVLEGLDDYAVPIESVWQLNERMYGLLTGLDKGKTRACLGDELFEQLRREPPPLDRGSCFDPAASRAVRRTTPAESLPRRESFEDSAARALPYFRDVIEPRALDGEAVMVVSSKNLLRALLFGVTGWPLDTMVHVDIPNCQPIVYRPSEGSLHLLQADGSELLWGMVGGQAPHLPVDKRAASQAARSRSPRPSSAP